MTIREWIRNREINGLTTFTFENVQDNYPLLSEQVVKNELFRLSTQKITASVYRGFYVIIPPQYAAKGIVPPLYHIDSLMSYLHKPYSGGYTSSGSSSSGNSSSSSSSSYSDKSYNSSSGSAGSSSNAYGDDNSGSYSGGSTGSSSYHSSSSSYDSYDEGYDDIYMNGDYDYDRYDSDDDYAAGVDDAMDEDYEEW